LDRECRGEIRAEPLPNLVEEALLCAEIGATGA
jgi:hypothetical protein